MGEVLTIREAGRRLKRHANTVYRPVNERRLPGIKVGGSWRVTEAALEKFLSGGDVVVDGEGKTEGQRPTA